MLKREFLQLCLYSYKYNDFNGKMSIASRVLIDFKSKLLQSRLDKKSCLYEQTFSDLDLDAGSFT